MLVTLSTVAGALAHEPAEPLAIPAPPPPTVIKPLKPAGLGVSAEAMAEYEARRLRIYPAERRGWHYTLGPTGEAHVLDFAEGVNVAAVDLAPRLVVAEGEGLLSVPSLMDRVGDNPSRLRERIERKQWTANTWTAVSAIGLVAAAVAYQMPPDDRRNWLIGSGSMLAGGLVFGGNAQRRANRLRRDLDLEYDRREIVEKVKAYNDTLADELGVDPEVSPR